MSLALSDPSLARALTSRVAASAQPALALTRTPWTLFAPRSRACNSPTPR
jgi:hypothetical protein